MNPNRGEGPGNFELPPQPASPEGEQGKEQNVEAPPARQEQVGKQAPQPAALPAVPQDIPAIDKPVIPVPPQDVTQTTAAPAIDDGDNMGSEWVNTVKSVAYQTRNDPFAQNHEMSKVKADYIQKRFNKTIKTDPDAK